MATQKGRNWSSGDIVTAANLSSIERGVSAVAEEYTPTTWANGNTVTAAALNNIEQGIVNAGGGGSSWQTIFEGSVTTAQEDETSWADLPEVADLSADTIKVTFNGTEYTCEKQTSQVGIAYGDPFAGDFSEYPFRIDINPKASLIQTESAGTYSLKIEEPQSGGSSDFSTAEVTITNNGNTDVYIYGWILKYDSKSEEMASYTTWIIVGNDTDLIEAVMYNGYSLLIIQNYSNIVTTGDAVYVGASGGNGMVEITGNGTITISSNSVVI